MLTPNIQPLEDSVLPVCSYHLIGSCLRNSAHHQPPGRNTKPTKYQIEDGGIRPNPVSLYMANIRLTSKSYRLALRRKIYARRSKTTLGMGAKRKFGGFEHLRVTSVLILGKMDKSILELGR
ncbi:hypothetical protein TNCV_892701 [Trichonephila clavipes]|nr:hypothetical protein TNCV_892701 [Trichonephila clavipes]